MSLREDVEKQQREREQKVRDALKKAHAKASGQDVWHEVHGETFSHGESTDAADFNDMLVTFSYPPEDLLDFLDEPQVQESVGRRLAILVRLPTDLLGRYLLKETEPRLIRAAQGRCKQGNQAGSGTNIIMPREIMRGD